MKLFTAILPLAAVYFAAPAQPQNPAASQPTPTQNQSTPPQSPEQQSPTAAQPAAQQQPAPLATVLGEAAQPLSTPGVQPSIATVSLEGVSLSGSLSVQDGRAIIGNNGAITAGDKTVLVSLTRGGSLNVCATTKIHLSTDNTVAGGGLMVTLDRGTFEAHYTPGQYSDVVLTPDLRILISPPGQADLSFRVNNEGDTCVDNHGDHAPYVLASSLLEGGAYRVQPNQRVLFEHGSLQQVVDNEQESCGCPTPQPTPAPASIARVGMPGITLHTSDEAAAPPPRDATATAAQNPFPLAESEGLKAPPSPPSTPVVPPGEAHAQITVPLVYNGENPGASSPAPPAAPSGSAESSACGDPLFPGVVCDADSNANQAASPKPESPPATAAGTAKPKKKSHGIGHFFRRLFGRG